MNSITLIELAGNGILIAIAYGLISFVLGILFGYAINSKYKKQVEELEREKVRLNSTVSSLESDLEESKKARTNADGEISLLRNQLREREARIKETEGKLAIINRRLEEIDSEEEKEKTEKKVEEKIEEKSQKFDDEVGFVESKPIKTKKIEPAESISLKKSATKTEIKAVDDIASSLIADDKKEKVEDKETKKAAKKAKKASKRGRPKGSKNKKSKSSKSESKSKSEDKPKAKRGRPKGSTNKKTAAKATTTKTETKETESKPKAKRGRPKGSTNSSVGKTTDAPKKRRGRPKGSTNKKTTTTPKKTTPAKRGRPAKAKMDNPTPAKTMKRTSSSGRGRKRDDLKIIEGIGPKMEEALRNGGVKTFNKMSKTTSEKLKAILLKANTRFGIAATESWPEQARLASNGEFDKLKELQDSLNRGRK